MNRYFLYSDRKLNKLNDFVVPESWWSRPYEYCFANEHLCKDNTVYCNDVHFANYASNKAKSVCCDEDTVNKQFDKIILINYVDKHIFDLPQTLLRYKKMLKNDGKIIITAESPTLLPEKLVQHAMSTNLRAIGSDYSKSKDCIYNDKYDLYCYRLVLELANKKIGYETKIEKPEKIKTIKKRARWE
jgi:hypothetical protein